MASKIASALLNKQAVTMISLLIACSFHHQAVPEVAPELVPKVVPEVVQEVVPEVKVYRLYKCFHIRFSSN